MPDIELVKGLVSIAVPAYKQTFLAEAIDSALGQTYHNIELIIVNDHSPYDLDRIVSKYDDARIRYYKNKRNLGKRSAVLNWNKCLEYARGEFFVLLCDDDVLMPDFVSELLKLAKKYPYCNVFHARKNEKDERTGETNNTSAWPEYETHEEYVKQYFNHNRKHTITEFLYRTTTIKDVQYKVFPSGFFSDDASLILFTKNGGISSSNNYLISFRFSDEHITSNGKYNIEKAKAMRKFLRWAKKEQICRPYIAKKIEEELETSIEFFVQCPGFKKFLTLPYIKWSCKNIRVIWIVFVRMLLRR